MVKKIIIILLICPVLFLVSCEESEQQSPLLAYINQINQVYQNENIFIDGSYEIYTESKRGFLDSDNENEFTNIVTISANLEFYNRNSDRKQYDSMGIVKELDRKELQMNYGTNIDAYDNKSKTTIFTYKNGIANIDICIQKEDISNCTYLYEKKRYGGYFETYEFTIGIYDYIAKLLSKEETMIKNAILDETREQKGILIFINDDTVFEKKQQYFSIYFDENDKIMDIIYVCNTIHTDICSGNKVYEYNSFSMSTLGEKPKITVSSVYEEELSELNRLYV